MSLDLTALQKACFSLEEAVANACDMDFINISKCYLALSLIES